MAFLLDDDDEQTFEAALSFIDGFEPADDLSSQNTDHLDELSKFSNVNPTRPKRRVLTSEEKKRRRAEINERKRLLRKARIYGDPNRARNARTREIAFLRVQLEKLQLDFQSLQRQKTEKQRREAQQPTDVLASAPQIPSLWQKLGDRQRQRREEAEETNVRLKLALEHHQKLTNALSSFLQMRANKLADDYSSFTDLRFVKHHVVQALDFSQDNSDFHRLLQLLDTVYQGMGTIFAANGLAHMDITPGEVHFREQTKGKYRYLEFFSNNILPFELNATKEATWAYFKGIDKHLGYGNLYSKAAKDLDEPFTVVEDLTKELYAGSARADIRIKQVIRRYVEDERDVVIRVYRAVPVEIKHKCLSRLTYQLQGYAVTKRAPISTPERELSILQLCTLVSFDQDEVEAASDPFSLRVFKDFLIAHTARNTRVNPVISVITFLLDDEGAAFHATLSFHAALSFVDEFVNDEDKATDLSASTQLQEGVEPPSGNSGPLLPVRTVTSGGDVDSRRTRERDCYGKQEFTPTRTERAVSAGRKSLAFVHSSSSLNWMSRCCVAERRNGRKTLELLRILSACRRSLGDLVRRRALKVTKECTALTEQSCLTHHVVNVLHVDGDMEDFRVLFRHL
ncbi:hypothetical protein C6341_g3471 [Phytophthora cactorum]|nr:hypothetical protein C6341_g3471 [Phytophthora cactorum]